MAVRADGTRKTVGWRSAGAVGDRPAPQDALRQALRWYLVWNLVALVVVVVGATLFSGVIARREALRDAERTARSVADAIVVPLANNAFHERDPVALSTMTEAMEYRSRDGSITHVKLWGDAGPGRGIVLWASQKPLVGQTFDMDPVEYALFGTNGMVSGISDLDEPENQYDGSADRLVEVYAGTRDAAGSPVIFEVYVSMAGLSQDTKALARTILPLPLGALLVLSLATFPLAVTLARRVDLGQQQLQRLLVNAVASSDLERRRIAQYLHDGPIQDLAGVGYALSSESRQLPEDGQMRARIERVSEILRLDLATLRTLMTDIHPPDLDKRGLVRSVRELPATTGLDPALVRMEIHEPITATRLTARLAYKAIREVLFNAAKHAHASSVSIRMHQSGEVLHFEVHDDGQGFDPAAEGPEGHLGLRLIAEMIADSGGSLDIDSAPGAGTIVRGALPM